MEEIRYMQAGDWEFWSHLDRHLPEEAFARKVRDQQGYVIRKDGRPVGLLRYQLFWDTIPFCTMLLIAPGFQGAGYGRKLMEHWENDMKARGCGMVLTSTQVDETAQHFYRKLGYQDCGGLLLDVPGYQQPMELFLRKTV